MKLKLLSLLCGIFTAAAISVTAHAADTHSYSIKSGAYDSPQFVWITADKGTDIHYTTDGSLPSSENAELYDSRIPVVVTENTRIRCAAYKDGALVENSALSVKIRTQAPSASKEGGSYTDAVRVKLDCGDKNAAIYYTTDGTTPTKSSKLYKGTLLIKSDVTLKFIAYSDGHTASRVITEEYDIGAVYEEKQRQELFELVNELRAQYGIAPLEEMPELSAVAQQRAVECAAYYSHYRPNGTKWDDLLGLAGLRRNVRAENLAYYYPTAKQALNGWLSDPWHTANLLNAEAKYIGIGYYEANGTVYWSQLFIGEE